MDKLAIEPCVLHLAIPTFYQWAKAHDPAAIGLTGDSFSSPSISFLYSSETHYISQVDLELMEILLPQAGMTYFTGAFGNKHPGTLLEE